MIFELVCLPELKLKNFLALDALIMDGCYVNGWYMKISKYSMTEKGGGWADQVLDKV
jgi:hypothetical protein